MGFLPSIGLLKLCILVLLCAPKMEKEKARILIGMANPKKEKETLDSISMPRHNNGAYFANVNISALLPLSLP